MLKAQASWELQGYRLGGALRRSEIGAPDVDDVTFASESAFVNLRRPKTQITDSLHLSAA